MSVSKTRYLRVSDKEVIPIELHCVESNQTDCENWLTDGHIQEILQLLQGTVTSYIDTRRRKQTLAGNKQQQKPSDVVTGSTVRFGYMFKSRPSSQTCLVEETFLSTGYEEDSSLRSFHVVKDKLVVYAHPIIPGSPKGMSQLMRVLKEKRQSSGQGVSISNYFQKVPSQTTSLASLQSYSRGAVDSQSTRDQKSHVTQSTIGSQKSLGGNYENHSVGSLPLTPPSEGRRNKIKNILERGDIGQKKRRRNQANKKHQLLGDAKKISNVKDNQLTKANTEPCEERQGGMTLNNDSSTCSSKNRHIENVLLDNVIVTSYPSPLTHCSGTYAIGDVQISRVESPCVNITGDECERGDSVTLISVEQMNDIQREHRLRLVTASSDNQSGELTLRQTTSSSDNLSGEHTLRQTTSSSDNQSGVHTLRRTISSSDNQSGEYTLRHTTSSSDNQSGVHTLRRTTSSSDNQSGEHTLRRTTSSSDNQSGVHTLRRTTSSSDNQSGTHTLMQTTSSSDNQSGEHTLRRTTSSSDNQSGVHTLRRTTSSSDNQSGAHTLAQTTASSDNLSDDRSGNQSETPSDSSSEKLALPPARFCTKEATRNSCSVNLNKFKNYVVTYEADIDTDSVTESPKFGARKVQKGEHFADESSRHKVQSFKSMADKTKITHKSRFKRKFPTFSDSDSEDNVPEKKTKTLNQNDKKFVNLEKLKMTSKKLSISNTFLSGDEGKSQPTLSFFMTNKSTKPALISSSASVTKTSSRNASIDEDMDIDNIDCELIKELSDIPKMVKNEADLELKHEIRAMSSIGKLNEEHLQYLIRNNEKYLRKIFEGKVSCDRHQAYKKGGNSRRDLNYKSRLGQYTEEQVDTVMESLIAIFCKRHHKYLDYIMKVLLPEMLIKLYMDVHDTSHEESEKKLAPRQFMSTS